jgi:hypothetical protein
MKRFFVTLAILSVCQVARAADVNSVDPNSYILENYIQENKELKQIVKAQRQKIEKLTDELVGAKKDVDQLTAAIADAKKEIERFQAEVAELKGKNAKPQEQTEEPNVTLPFTGEETPLTMVKAYPKKFIGKTFIVIGCVKVQDYYNYKYEYAKETHISLSLDEIRPNLTVTGESMDLYVRREISQGLVEKINKNADAGLRFAVIRVKATILENRYDPEGSGIQAELINWQFYSKDKKDWQDWVISEGTAKPQNKALRQIKGR